MKGHFKTALGQVTIILDATVTEALSVRDLVIVTPANDSTPAKVEPATGKSNATHIVALSDMTLEGAFNLKQTRADEIYSDVVASSNTAKKVGLYKIIDKDDVIEG